MEQPQMRIVRSLEADSLGFETQEIFRRLEPEQIDEYRAKVTDHLIELRKLNEELAAAKEAHKEAAKPHNEAISAALDLIKAGGKMDEVQCYKIPDWDRMRIKVTTPEGEVVYERAMRPEERQMTIN